MSVYQANRKPWQGRQAQFQYNVGGNQPLSINRTIVEVWEALTNNPDDDAVIVLDSPLLPQAFQSHPSFASCLLTKGQAVQNSANPHQWLCTFDYTNIQPRANDDNPLSRPDVVSWTKVPTKKPVYQATRGQIVRADGTVIDSSTTDNPIPIVNSALDPYQTVLEDDDFDRQCSIQRNVAFVPDFVEDLANTVNDDVVLLGGLSCDEATLRFMPVEIGPLTRENDVYYYPITMVLLRRTSGWDWKLPDQGLQAYITNTFNGDKTKAACVFNGVPVTSPVNLDGGAGNGFGMGKQLNSTDPSQQVFITYQRPRGDFTQLRLPPR